MTTMLRLVCVITVLSGSACDLPRVPVLPKYSPPTLEIPKPGVLPAGHPQQVDIHIAISDIQRAARKFLLENSADPRFPRPDIVEGEPVIVMVGNLEYFTIGEVSFGFQDVPDGKLLTATVVYDRTFDTTRGDGPLGSESILRFTFLVKDRGHLVFRDYEFQRQGRGVGY